MHATPCAAAATARSLQREPVADLSPADSEALFHPLLAGFDAIGLGVTLLDDDLRPVYANASAKSSPALLNLGTGGDDEDPTRADRIRAARRAGAGGQRQLVELLSRDGSHFAAVVPIVADGRSWLFVVHGRQSLCGPIELQMFSSRHGLTYAEGRVLVQLSTGRRPAEIAKAHAVSVTTVLTQVAAIRSKTFASSVRELLAMVSRLPPLQPVFAG